MNEQQKVSPQRLNERIRTFAFSDSHNFTPSNLVRLERNIRDNNRFHEYLEFPYNSYFKGLDDLRKLLPYNGIFADKAKLDGLFDGILPIFDAPFFSQLWEHNQDNHTISIQGRSIEVPAILLSLDVRDEKGAINYASLNLEARSIIYDYPSPPEEASRRDFINFDYENGLWVLSN